MPSENFATLGADRVFLGIWGRVKKVNASITGAATKRGPSLIVTCDLKKPCLRYSVASHDCLQFSRILIAEFEAQGPNYRLRGSTSSLPSCARAALTLALTFDRPASYP